MKKINILMVLGLFVLLIGTAQQAYAIPLRSFGSVYVGGDGRDGQLKPILIREAAQLNAAASKFEGLLNAYSVNQNRAYGGVKGEVEVGAVVYDSARRLSHALEQFNLALVEVYPTLSEEEQLAVREAYSSLGLYLEDLVTETNSVFGKEVLTIEHQESDGGLWTVNAWTLFD